MLRRIREGVAGEKELTFWDERLAYEGARVTDSRRRAVDGLNEHAVPAHSDLSDGESLKLEYRPRITASSGTGSEQSPDIGSMNAEAIEQQIAKALPAEIGRAHV